MKKIEPVPVHPEKGDAPGSTGGSGPTSTGTGTSGTLTPGAAFFLPETIVDPVPDPKPAQGGGGRAAKT